MAFSLHKSKNLDINQTNSIKSIEKQYDETNINMLFEQVLNSDNSEIIKKTNLNGENNSENYEKNTKIDKEEIPTIISKKEIDKIEKTFEKFEIKRPSYQMEVENISISFTNNTLDELKSSNKNGNEKNSNKDILVTEVIHKEKEKFTESKMYLYNKLLSIII